MNGCGNDERQDIAVIGIGCRYPGADGPRELWENILARRQEFRQIPDCRLPLEEYHDPDPAVPDKTYGQRAAVIDGFEFDWTGRRIPKKTFEGTDIVQWLALEVALQALDDAGLERDSVPRERTGVVLGNTLTGEHTRSNTLRLRWPFVRRALVAAATAKGLPPELQHELCASMEQIYKSVFHPVTEDTLAGGLSNTIAGRICNFLDLHGGGYTVDGACSSSLLAICTAANGLAAGELDLALAGGVDISLDTFELIGFAKTGALSPDDMRVYDRRGNGFIPGEGCGFVVLKRLADARRDGDFVYAIVRGWGVSSDGKGGLTAPSRDGQARALRRAYERAGYSPRDIDFVEGHGTGTKVGDKIELEAVASVVGTPPDVSSRRVGMTSFKSIMGHTKAAAGVGAFIKAVLALNRRVLPPTAGCTQPHPVFDSTAAALYPVLLGEVAEPDRRLRAGVSAMGFGGINTHVALESGDAPADRIAPQIQERALLASHQETEVFVFSASSLPDLHDHLLEIGRQSEQLSQGELTDLAAHLGRQVDGQHSLRAAVVAGSPRDLATQLRSMAERLAENPPQDAQVHCGPKPGWWIGRRVAKPRIGFLFPGQGSQQLLMARTLVERFGWARELVQQAECWLAEVGVGAISRLIYRPLDRAAGQDEREAWSRELSQTEVAQPAICMASLLLMRYLKNLGIEPTAVGGHSLGDLTALHAADAFDEKSLIQLAGIRGRLMATHSMAPGSMASLGCSVSEAEGLLRSVAGYVAVANLNSPRQTVVSGDELAIGDVLARAHEAGIAVRRLPVSNAFHSRLIAPAAEALRREAPVPERLERLGVRYFSSMAGALVEPGLTLPDHFAEQMLGRVDFVHLVQQMHRECDLMIEVGPGRILSGLAADILNDQQACLPMSSRPNSDRDLNLVLARAFAYGLDIHWSKLYEGRLVRPYLPADQRRFIDNPCERPLPSFELEQMPRWAVTGSLESDLLAAVQTTPDELAGYLERRKGFLINIVKADLHSLNGALVSLPAESLPSRARTTESERAETVQQNPSSKVEPAPAELSGSRNQDNGVEALLLRLAAERTGFPEESLALENRLLDDLNLDSIKAAELVADAAKQLGIAGKIDPSLYANASLTEIAAVLQGEPAAASSSSVQSASDEPPLPPPVDAGPSWVRNFEIEFVDLAA